MSDLDSIIKRTITHASPHSKKLFGQNPMTGEETLDLLSSKKLQIMASIKPDGNPHIAATTLIVTDGRIYMGMDAFTRRAKNLKAKPRFAIMAADGWKRQAIIEGRAEFLDMKSREAENVQEAQKNQYGWTSTTLARVLPAKVFTWKQPTE